MAASTSGHPTLSPIETLRARLAALQPQSGRGVWRFGDARVDDCLPGGGLPRGVLHEIAAGGIEAETGAVTAGFLACLLAGLAPRGEIFWIAPTADLHPPGLLPYGFDPSRLIQVQTRDDTETLATLEAVLRSGSAAAAIGETGRLGRIPARRLQLACLKHGTTGFALRRWPYGKPAIGEDPTAAVTRWDIAPAPSALTDRDPGPARWRVSLVHARGGIEGSWIMESTASGDPHAPHPFRVVAELAPAQAAQPARLVG
jgi:protein ImuA